MNTNINNNEVKKEETIKTIKELLDIEKMLLVLKNEFFDMYRWDYNQYLIQLKSFIDVNELVENKELYFLFKELIEQFSIAGPQISKENHIGTMNELLCNLSMALKNFKMSYLYAKKDPSPVMSKHEDGTINHVLFKEEKIMNKTNEQERLMDMICEIYERTVTEVNLIQVKIDRNEYKFNEMTISIARLIYNVIDCLGCDIDHDEVSMTEREIKAFDIHSSCLVKLIKLLNDEYDYFVLFDKDENSLKYKRNNAIFDLCIILEKFNRRIASSSSLFDGFIDREINRISYTLEKACKYINKLTSESFRENPSYIIEKRIQGLVSSLAELEQYCLIEELYVDKLMRVESISVMKKHETGYIGERTTLQ